MKVDRAPRGNERGFALIVALLMLVFLSLLASAFMASMNVETKIVGRSSRDEKAFNVAEAGVQEAAERLRQGDIGGTDDPKDVWQIFLQPEGSVPSVGGDTTALATAQDPNDWLEYSTPTKGPDVLTVTYKTDAERKVIYRYDEAKVPPVNLLSGEPIYQILSTATVRDSRRQIVSEMVLGDVQTNLKGAVMGGQQVHLQGDAFLCGYDHGFDTPTWTDCPQGRNGESGACDDDLANGKWELGTAGAGDLPGAWSEGVITNTKKGEQYGSPVAALANEPGFYKGAWQVFGMTQGDFYNRMGVPVKNPPYLKGHIDGPRFYQGDVVVRGGSGSGFLYCEGNLTIDGDFTYRGLLYCTGRFIANGKLWVLGGVVAGEQVFLKNENGWGAVLYSHDAISRGVSQNLAKVVTVSWREMP